jgi:predicted PhzF superfamily epimerase YddE/YHI9
VPTVQLPLDVDLGTRRPQPYFVVDVFTDTPLEGNQLAVFTDARSFSNQQMQRLAREMNYAETVFAQVEGSADGVRRVRVGGQAVLVARGEFRLG